MTEINNFRDENSFLSNFYPCKITSILTFDSKPRIYQSVEHAYQAAKASNINDLIKILHSTTPGMAKKLGNQVALIDGWESKKVSIMDSLLRQKFYQAEFALLLLKTGDSKLTEGNTWGDTFWGVCNGKGLNTLGKLLMKIRSDLEAISDTPKEETD